MIYNSGLISKLQPWYDKLCSEFDNISQLMTAVVLKVSYPLEYKDVSFILN
jgi:hypothetical protein